MCWTLRRDSVPAAESLDRINWATTNGSTDEGAIPAKYKELMGLVVSAGLRCDDCINYHVIQSYRLGATRPEEEEALNVALVVGGSIVIPHLRRAYELLAELYG